MGGGDVAIQQHQRPESKELDGVGNDQSNRPLKCAVATGTGLRRDRIVAIHRGTSGLYSAWWPCSPEFESCSVLIAPWLVLASLWCLGPGSCYPAAVLTEIEQTARADGDITTANDARYDRLTLAARARSGSVWASVQDGFFYRTVAGYLVRPRQPLIFLGVLVAAGFLLRCLLRPPMPARLRERIKRLARALRRATPPTGEAGLAPEPPAQTPAPGGSGNPGHGQPSRGEPAAASPRPQQAAGRTATEEKAEPAETAARPSRLVRPFEALHGTTIIRVYEGSVSVTSSDGGPAVTVSAWRQLTVADGQSPGAPIAFSTSQISKFELRAYELLAKSR